MHYASAENISKSFGIRTLFKNISFYVEEGDKIAFVARNGTGKSTLLRIFAGLDTPDDGTLWVHKDVKVIMLQQDTAFSETKSIRDNVLRLDNPVIKTVNAYEKYLDEGNEDVDLLADIMGKMDELNAWSFESELKQILGKLNLHNLEAKMNTLSGGQRKRVALAQSLIEAQLHEGRCLLILDEPTNHLDVSMIEWLENFLSTHKMTILLVTHDRYFLDTVCNEIIEMEDEKLYVYKGDYDYFLEQKSLRQEVQASELQKDKNIFRKELEWMRKQPKARTTKSKSRQDAFKEVEERVSIKKEDTDVSLQVKMTRLGGKILEMKKINKSYSDKLIMKGFDYTFKRGERIGIVGKNGVGKSTFLDLLNGKSKPDSGEVIPGVTTKVGYFTQETENLNPAHRVIEEVKEIAEFITLADGSQISASRFLEMFLFAPEKQYTFIEKLSGGEKKRLQLLKILVTNPNFLILDEPTNDFDIETLNVLEDFLEKFNGCLVLVSHDRYFMDHLVDQLFVFEGDGKIRLFNGNYSDFRTWIDEKDSGQLEIEMKPVARTEEPKNEKQKITFKEKQEYEQLAKEIEGLEFRKAELSGLINVGNLEHQKLMELSMQIESLSQTIEVKTSRWLELAELV